MYALNSSALCGGGLFRTAVRAVSGELSLCRDAPCLHLPVAYVLFADTHLTTLHRQSQSHGVRAHNS